MILFIYKVGLLLIIKYYNKIIIYDLKYYFKVLFISYCKQGFKAPPRP